MRKDIIAKKKEELTKLNEESTSALDLVTVVDFMSCHQTAHTY